MTGGKVGDYHRDDLVGQVLHDCVQAPRCVWRPGFTEDLVVDIYLKLQLRTISARHGVRPLRLKSGHPFAYGGFNAACGGQRAAGARVFAKGRKSNKHN